jgi:aspartyl-tRNA(Asn)/glutamyl-tRNA(Gln) amidotransferase subunit B
MTKYEAIIGMEVHAQLLTNSKMFCECNAQIFGVGPNTQVCPVCLGMPGVLPVVNHQVVRHAIMIGLALNCRIRELAVFSRKNYFYPDLPKSYQISQYDLPLCQNGWIDVDDSTRADASAHRIRIRRVHLEEDPAKLFHIDGHSLVDFNRSGLPLIEIVTEPDLRTPEEARQYLTKLRAILRYLGVSTGDMEKGAMRCEPNVSVRPIGSRMLGTKVEVKNLNSFRSVQMALEYEIARQIRILDSGEQIHQVTMGWDEQRGRTVEQRYKEEADDYRYFPEPDLPPLHVTRAWVDEIRGQLPELPEARRDRFTRHYALSLSDAIVLTADRDVADYFETAVAAGRDRGINPKTVSNWLTGDLFRLIKEAGVEVKDVRVTPAALTELIALVEQRTITGNSSKSVLGEMFATGLSPTEIVEKRGLGQVFDEQLLARVLEEIVAAHPEEVAKYQSGKETLLSWFVGQAMKATRGKANPQVIMTLLRERLSQ